MLSQKPKRGNNKMDNTWISVDDLLPEMEDAERGTSRLVLIRDHFDAIESAWYQYACAYQQDLEDASVGYKVGWHASPAFSGDAPLIGITHWIDINVLPKIPEVH